jgi:hypothetical protein
LAPNGAGVRRGERSCVRVCGFGMVSAHAEKEKTR